MPDVISGLAARRHDGQTLVAFAAEHGPEGPAERARASSPPRASMRSSSTTSPPEGIGFDAAENEVTILTAARTEGEPAERHVARAGKELIAAAILDAVEEMRPARWEQEARYV